MWTESSLESSVCSPHCCLVSHVTVSAGAASRPSHKIEFIVQFVDAAVFTSRLTHTDTLSVTRRRGALSDHRKARHDVGGMLPCTLRTRSRHTRARYQHLSGAGTAGTGQSGKVARTARDTRHATRPMATALFASDASRHPHAASSLPWSSLMSAVAERAVMPNAQREGKHDLPNSAP